MTTSSEEAGGIAAVNRMLIPALVELADERDLRIAILSMQGTDVDRPKELPARHFYRGFGSRRSLFALELLRWSKVRPIFLFERGLARALLPLAVARLARTVIFAHGSENWQSVRWMDSWSIRLSDLIVTNSHFTLRKMRQRFPRLRGAACPLGLSTSFPLRAEPAALPSIPLVYEACDRRAHELGGRVLLLTGRLHPSERKKGHDLLISVLPRVLVRHPNVQLVFAGPGSDRSHIGRLAYEARVASSVFAPGFLETPALERLYEQCYAFVMPSRQEGFGLVYLEAMNCAKACVGCFGDGAEDVIVDGKTGYLLRDPKDLDELLTVLLKLLDDAEHTKSLGRNGFDRLNTHFTLDQFRNRFKRILARALENPRMTLAAADGESADAAGRTSPRSTETQEVGEPHSEVGGRAGSDR